MSPRKRTSTAANGILADDGEPMAKRRSSRQAAAAISATAKSSTAAVKGETPASQKSKKSSAAKSTPSKKPQPETKASKAADAKAKTPAQPAGAAKKAASSSKGKSAAAEKAGGGNDGVRAGSEDPDVDDIPTVNPEAPRHDGEWYWLLKAEPETRLENGVDVKFSIDDLRAKTKPEGWDGIRAYPARNNMRNMNAGDKAFFYHSNCKEPAIVGVMEIVKEFSEDKSARRPGPYYDPSSTKEKPKWSLVHVEFRKKFAVPIPLKELRELGQPGGPLQDMQMLKLGRLSVSRVSGSEWKALCEIADQKAEDAGLKHEE
ncbi:hypothetical protein K4F52_004761 [Lecanicillium sp. MT-2017a]|nr:hypothetical protein K4F52_004761 [Lecanicillium sp. MT-2017a]